MIKSKRPKKAKFKKFRAFIREVGASELARKLGVSRQAVSLWYNCKSSPSLDKTLKIVFMSNGSLSIFDIHLGGK